MRKILLTAAMAGLMVSGCQSPKRQFHKTEQKMYTFADGRQGYQGDDGVWYFLVMQAGQNGQRFETYHPGEAPTAEEILDTQTTMSDADVDLDTSGVPATEAEVSASSDSGSYSDSSSMPSDASAGGDVGGDSGGGDAGGGGE